MKEFLPVNVVSEIVVAAVHNEAAHGDAEREKHLAGCGTPDLWVEFLFQHYRTRASTTIALEKKALTCMSKSLLQVGRMKNSTPSMAPGCRSPVTSSVSRMTYGNVAAK
jgi:hypothetical protein